MDCRVKPGNDNRFNMTESRYSCRNGEPHESLMRRLQPTRQ
jgi:hypothetical protein